MKPFLPRLVSLAVLAAFASAARATLIDFEDAVPVDDFGFLRTYGDAVESGGFLFTGSSLTSWLPEGKVFFNADYTGSTALFAFDQAAVLTMTKSGGGAFSLDEMDLAHTFLGGPGEDVTFIGTRTDGAEVSRTFSLRDGDDGLQTVTFQGFTDLVSVRWNQTPALHQFDNVRVEAIPPTPGPAAAVPFALLFLRRRRRA